MKKYCKECHKMTTHALDGDNPSQIDRGEPNTVRCTECGQRPDRPRDGETVTTVCPQCGKTMKAAYVDVAGLDILSIDCPACDLYTTIAYNDGYGYTRERFLQDRNTAQAIATGVWNECKGVDRLECISVTVGHYTATVAKAEGRTP